MSSLFQGDILHVPSLRTDVIVVSREFFNETGLAFVCPLVREAAPHALHIDIHGKKGIHGYALCEALKAIDVQKRHFSKTDEAVYADIMNLSDAIQAIFDYYPGGASM